MLFLGAVCSNHLKRHFVPVIAILFLVSLGYSREAVKKESAFTEDALEAAVIPDDYRRKKAREIALLMSDDELAGQVIMTGIDARGPVSAGELNRLKRIKPGAIMLFRKNLDIENELIRRMNREAAAASALVSAATKQYIAPFIACDHEGGEIQRFRNKVARLSAPLSYQELALRFGEEFAAAQIRKDAEEAARELAGLGITMNLAPIAEPLTPDNEAFLLTRSYGTRPEWVAEAAFQFMLGMESAGIACVVKHFPGNSGVDPHQKLPVLWSSETELRQITAPFYTLITKGIPAGVMVAHSIAQVWDAERPASLSPIVIQNKLIAGSVWSGIILADDFSMGAVAGDLRSEEAVIGALSAGVDMVMAWPANLISIHTAIRLALEKGILERERLRSACERIVYQKIRFGLAAF